MAEQQDPEERWVRMAPPRGSRRWIWVLVAAVLVFAAIGTIALVRRAALRNDGPSVVAAGPGTASAAPGELPGLALDGSGGVVAYLTSPTTVQRADLATGATTTTSVPAVDQPSTLVAGTGWVVARSVGTASGVLLRDGGTAQAPPVAVQQAGRAYSGGSGSLWVVPQEPAGGFRTATLVDVQGDPVGSSSIKVPAALGLPVGHLTGSLVATNDDGTWVAATTGVDHVSRGVLLGIGTDAVLTWDCDDKGRCDARSNRTGQPAAYFPAARKSLLALYGQDIRSARGYGGALSPDRRWVALALPKATRTGSDLVLVDLRSGHRVEVPGALADAKGTDQAAWTPNGRYLLAVTDGRLRAFDATTGKVATVAGTPDGLLHVTIAGSATM